MICNYNIGKQKSACTREAGIFPESLPTLRVRKKKRENRRRSLIVQISSSKNLA